MTVAEIQDYIQGMHDSIAKGKPFTKSMMKMTLSKINSMLDELQPNAKWIHKYGSYYCSNCGSEYHKSSITPLPNTCIECNARMEDE